jgi:hypothetical protein
MRRAPSAVLLSVLVPLGVVVPVVSAPHASAHPVAPQLRSQALHGVDRSALGSTAGRASFLAAGSSRTPAVLVATTHVARFDLLGVTWSRHSAAADLAVTARAHGEHGWSAWTALDTQDSPAAGEGSTARPGTEPLWVGDSDGYQVRVDVRRGVLPAGLRVDLVDPGSSAADATPGPAHALSSAAAATDRPTIFTRAQWGADEKLRGTGPRYTGRIQAGFVHHTAGTNGYSEADVPKIIRGIYAYHVKGNGWSDIGYNYLVDRFGRLWEGRYGGMTKNVLGAHTGGFNVNTFAVSAIGDYDRVQPPAVMVDSIARLMAWKFSLNFDDPNGTTVLTSQGGGTSKYRAGTKVTFNVISGHRDAGNTECPGRYLYAQLPTIRQLVTTYLGTALLDPAPTPPAATYGAGKPIVIGARVTGDQTWSLQIRDVCHDTVVRTLSGTASPTVPVAAAWDLADDAGVPVRPGSYGVLLASAGASGAARTWTGTVTVQAARSAPAAPAPVGLPGRTGFVPVDPVPLYDTHDAGHFPLGPGGRVDLVVPGAGSVPAAGVAAVALSIAATCTTADTTITTWAAGSRKPASAALDVTSGTPTSGLAVVPLGGGGAVSLANATGTTELAVHVVGYYPTAGGDVFRPVLRTVRLYDSRKDPAGTLAPGDRRTITVPALSGIPATSMSGALLNVTALSPAGTGHLTVSSGSSARDAATVAFTHGSLVKTRAVARLADGTVTVTDQGAASHVVVDLVGWWAPPAVVSGRLFQSRAATRVLDTRTGVGARRGRVGAGGVLAVKVAGKGKPAPAGVRAVVLTLTARDATRATFVTAWPYGGRRPVFPDVSAPAFKPTSNLVVVRVGSRGRIKVTNGSGSANVVADVVGYYP